MPLEDIGPVSELTFGQHSTAELYDEMRERGSHLDVREACQYFCTSENVESVLSKALEGTGKGLGHYRARADQTLDFLQAEGRIARPMRYRPAVDAIRNCNPNQVVIIGPNLLRGENHLKKGDIISVEHEMEKGRLRQGIAIDVAVDGILKAATMDRALAGYSWQGYNSDGEPDEINRILGLWDTIRGCIYDAALQHLALEVRIYEGSSPYNTGILGSLPTIPSFHDEGRWYRVGFQNLPMWTSDRRQAHAQGYNARLMSDSPRELWDQMKVGRRKEAPNILRDADTVEQRWDHHAVFAHRRIARELEKTRHHLIQPFRRPDADSIRTYFKMIHNTLRRERDDEGKWHLHPLRGADVELLMWKYIRRKKETQR